MQRDIRKYLTDIAIHIDYIDIFLGGNRDFKIYEKDLATQYAVERALGIIGEAVNQLRKTDATINISGMNHIVGLRNILIHAYDSINNAIVWSVIVNHLPVLKMEVTALLEELESK
ncbi:DUF86 domain-containing protein [Spirosoma montaniterrae]|uniref:Antitoxin n=1 Tax=Spirosoma montaniterrae TaxID=1178516 RepID=A0A1P9X1W7_9BACT|nr:HepT-like ribonuclease domain-containing protein [Spirosoma montaniterrae]AQG81632.1 hypothetical protein AWR27_21385 [Spirosoma montaniterrae]